MKREKNKLDLLVPMGCAEIHLRHNRALEYMSLQLSRSNKAWHAQWFYLRNDAAAPLPEFTGHPI
jgi:hypothetical protein